MNSKTARTIRNFVIKSAKKEDLDKDLRVVYRKLKKRHTNSSTPKKESALKKMREFLAAK